jgi:acyl carrier protein
VLEKEIRKVVSLILKKAETELEAGDRLGATKGWDSLAHVEIISKLESLSGITLNAEDAIFAETLGDLIEIFSGE